MRRLNLLVPCLWFVVPDLAGAQRTWHPTITGVSPNVATHGANITLTGTDLNPPGWQRRLRFPLRYSTGTGQANLGYTGSATQVVVTADRSMRGDSIRVEWVSLDTSVTNLNPIPAAERIRYLPAAIVVQSAPDLTFAGPTLTPDLGSPFALLVASNGQVSMKGRFLRRTSMPVVTLGGATLTTLTHQYEANGLLNSFDACCAGGADRVVVTAPSTRASGWLVLDNSLGRDSIAATFALPPAPSQVVRQLPTGTAALSPALTLQRGQVYAVRGQHLSVTNTLGGATSIKRGTVQLGGTTITPSFASDTNIVFTVPATFTPGPAPLTVSTAAGSAAMGTFTVTDAAVALDVVGLTQRSIVTAGTDALFTAQLNIPSGASKETLGSLIVTAPGAPIGAVTLPAAIPITGPSVEFKVRAGELQSSTPVTIQVSHEANGLNGVTTQTRQATFTIRPPHPTAIALPASLTTGTTTDLTVTFDSTTRRRSAIFALVSSSNPNVVAVPASVTIDGNKATIPVTIAPSLQGGGTATISATIDGATVSATATVQLPTIRQVTLYRSRTTTVLSSALPGEEVTAVAAFSGALAYGASVALVSGDTALRPALSSSSISQRSLPEGLSTDGATYVVNFTVRPGVSEQRTATVTATYGGSTRSSNLTITPVVISGFTATPTSGPPGSTLTATALLAPAPIALMSIEFASTNTARATIGSYSSSVGIGSTSKSVAIQLVGPVSAPQQVPITVTLRAGQTIVSTQTLVVTVTP